MAVPPYTAENAYIIKRPPEKSKQETARDFGVFLAADKK